MSGAGRRKIEAAIAAIEGNEFSALDVDKHGIGDADATRMAEALATNRMLMHLDIAHNKIRDEGMVEIAEALSHNSSLTFLHVAGNPFTEEAARKLGQGLSTTKSVVTAKVDKASLPVSMIAGSADPGVTHLKFEAQEWTEKECAFIFELLKRNPICKTLELRAVGLRLATCEWLGEVMRDNNVIERIILSGVLEPAAFLPIAAALKRNDSLLALDYQGQVIMESGADQLVESLRYNTALTDLKLYQTHLGDEKAQDVLEVLRPHPSLRSLMLVANDITSECGDSLASLVRDVTSLTYLGLGSNKIHVEGWAKLGAAVIESSTLRGLDLSACDIIVGDGDDTKAAEVARLRAAIPLRAPKVKVRAATEAWQIANAQYQQRAKVSELKGINTLCSVMATNTSLAALVVTGNHIKAKWGKYLARAAMESRSLQMVRMASIEIPVQDVMGRESEEVALTFAGTDFSSTDLNFMATLLTINRFVLTLNLCRSDLRLEGVRLLAKALAHNNVLQLLRLKNYDIPVQNWRGSNYVDDLASEQIWHWQDCVVVGELLKVNQMANVIHLNGNGIDEYGLPFLADGIRYNESVTVLELVWNHFGPKGAVSLANALRHNTSIDTLLLHGNGIGAGEGAQALADMLRVNSTITSLAIRWNNLGHEGAREICDGILELKVVEDLDLRANELHDKGAAVVADMLAHNSHILSLTLRENAICAAGMEALAESLMRPNCQVEELDMEWNSIEAEGAYFVADMLRVNTTLETVNISKNELYNEGATAIAEMLRVNRSIKEISMVDTTLGAPGVQAVAQALTYNRTIERVMFSAYEIPVQVWNGATGEEHIDLRGQQMTLLDIVFLAQSMKLNRIARSLDLRDNIFSNEGAAILQGALEANLMIESIKFSALDLKVQDLNGVTGRRLMDMSTLPVSLHDVTFIAASLSVNTPVQFLDLSGCGLGPEAGRILGTHLCKNSVLASLKLSHNNMGDHGAVHLAKILDGDNVLQVLDLADNEIGAEGAEALGNATERNTNIRYVRIERRTHLVQRLRGDNGDHHLDYSGLNMSVVDCAFMMTCMKWNVTTRSLDLSFNDLDNESTDYVGRMLKKNRALYHLDYSYNTCNWMGGDTFVQVLRSNRSLKSISLIETRVGKKANRQISEMLEVNQRCDVRWWRGQIMEAHEYFPNGDKLELPNVHNLNGFDSRGTYTVREVPAWQVGMGLLEAGLALTDFCMGVTFLVYLLDRGIVGWFLVGLACVIASGIAGVVFARQDDRPWNEALWQSVHLLVVKDVFTLLAKGQLRNLLHDIRSDIPRFPWIVFNRMRIIQTGMAGVPLLFIEMMVGILWGWTSLLVGTTVMSAVSVSMSFALSDLGPIRNALWIEERDQLVEDSIRYEAQGRMHDRASQRSMLPLTPSARLADTKPPSRSPVTGVPPSDSDTPPNFMSKAAQLQLMIDEVAKERAKGLNIKDYRREAREVDVEWMRFDTIVVVLYRAVEAVSRPAMLATLYAVGTAQFWIWFLFAYVAYSVYWSLKMGPALYDDLAKFTGLTARVLWSMGVFPGFSNQSPRWVTSYHRADPGCFFVTRFIEDAVIVSLLLSVDTPPQLQGTVNLTAIANVVRVVLSGPYWILANVDQDNRVDPRRHLDIKGVPATVRGKSLLSAQPHLTDAEKRAQRDKALGIRTAKVDHIAEKLMLEAAKPVEVTVTAEVKEGADVRDSESEEMGDEYAAALAEMKAQKAAEGRGATAANGAGADATRGGAAGGLPPLPPGVVAAADGTPAHVALTIDVGIANGEDEGKGTDGTRSGGQRRADRHEASGTTGGSRDRKDRPPKETDRERDKRDRERRRRRREEKSRRGSTGSGGGTSSAAASDAENRGERKSRPSRRDKDEDKGKDRDRGKSKSRQRNKDGGADAEDAKATMGSLLKMSTAAKLASRSKSKHRSRSDRERSRDKDKSRSKDKDRERDGDREERRKERDRDRDKERDKERDKGRDKGRDKRRDTGGDKSRDRAREGGDREGGESESRAPRPGGNTSES